MTPVSVMHKKWRKLAVASVLLFGAIYALHIFCPQMLRWDQIKDPGPFYVAYPHEYHFTWDQPNLCMKHRPFIVVIVPVAPHQVESRNAIRSTWGNDSLVQNGMVLVLFLLGVPGGNLSDDQLSQLHQEHLQHQDLLQSNFVDSYKNLTIKTMVMLEWLQGRCPEVPYAMKVDADILLNVKGLVNMLMRFNQPQSNYITGLVWHGSKVMRDPSNKFYIPHNVYPNKVYPPYPLGMCYIISMDLPKKILWVAKYIKPIFIEDAYIGLCLERLNIAPSNPPDIRQFVVNPPAEYDRCYYSNLIAVITRSPAQLIDYWMDIHKPEPC